MDMLLPRLFSAISDTIRAEALRGFRVISLTVSGRLPRTPLREQYPDYEIVFSSDLRPTEFCLSLRASPTDRHVNFYRISNGRHS